MPDPQTKLSPFTDRAGAGIGDGSGLLQKGENTLEYSNISSMLSQLKGQSAYTADSTGSASGRQLQAAEIILKNMEPGQIFSGEITDIRGNYITITLQNMQSVQARLAESFEFLIGQKVAFQVKENQDGQLFIKPVLMDATQNGELMVAERALEAAGIRMTEKTLELVKNLLSAGQPIDRQNIQSYIRQMARFPQAEIQDLVSLHKYQIPVNEENLNQLSNYRQFEHSMLTDLEELGQRLPEAVGQMNSRSPEQAQAFLRELTAILCPEEAVAEEGKSPAEAAPHQAGAMQETAEGQAGRPAAETVEAASQNEQTKTALPVKQQELFHALSGLLGAEGEEKERAGRLLRSLLDEQLLLKPEEVADKEQVKEYYQELAQKGERLKNLFSSYGRETEQLMKPAQNLNQNLKFMQSLNEMFTYIQLPLKLSQQQAHGDLYVYARRKAGGNAEEGFSALLRLDMENLGAVEVLVRLKGQRVVTNFTLETVELLDFIEEHMELLTRRLEQKGYSCSVQTSLKEKQEQERSFEQYLTGEAGVCSDRKRFSFDVRA